MQGLIKSCTEFQGPWQKLPDWADSFHWIFMEKGMPMWYNGRGLRESASYTADTVRIHRLTRIFRIFKKWKAQKTLRRKGFRDFRRVMETMIKILFCATAGFARRNKTSQIVLYPLNLSVFRVSLSILPKIYQYFWRVRLADSNTRIRRSVKMSELKKP